MNATKFKPQEGAKFSSWAYRILMNTAFTRYQKKVKEGQRFVNIDHEFEHMVGDGVEHATLRERQVAVETVLARLPGHFVYVLRLHYLERWPHQAIADKTGESVGTVKARIHRTKAAFRKETGDEELDMLLSD